MTFSGKSYGVMLAWVCIVLTLTVFAPGNADAAGGKKGEITGVNIGQVFSMKQSEQLLLVDCRPPFYFRKGHIDGAISLPLKKYDKLISERQKQLSKAVRAKKFIVLYCQNVKCPDAYAVAKKLITLGYSVSIYKGGWEEWKESELE